MLQSYYFFRSDSGEGGTRGISKADLLKWKGASDDPFESEEKIKELVAPSSFVSKEIDAWIDAQIHIAEKKKDQATANAWKLRKTERSLMGMDEKINSQFFAEFIAFLLGKTDPESCEYKTIMETGPPIEHVIHEGINLHYDGGWKVNDQPPVRRVDKYGDEIRAYIQTYTDRHFQMIKKAIRLKMEGPKTLAEHWLYFKYIVKGHIKDFGTFHVPDIIMFGNSYETDYDAANFGAFSSNRGNPGNPGVGLDGYGEYINSCTPGKPPSVDVNANLTGDNDESKEGQKFSLRQNTRTIGQLLDVVGGHINVITYGRGYTPPDSDEEMEDDGDDDDPGPQIVGEPATVNVPVLNTKEIEKQFSDMQDQLVALRGDAWNATMGIGELRKELKNLQKDVQAMTNDGGIRDAYMQTLRTTLDDTIQEASKIVTDHASTIEKIRPKESEDPASPGLDPEVVKEIVGKIINETRESIQKDPIVNMESLRESAKIINEAQELVKTLGSFALQQASFEEMSRDMKTAYQEMKTLNDAIVKNYISFKTDFMDSTVAEMKRTIELLQGFLSEDKFNELKEILGKAQTDPTHDQTLPRPSSQESYINYVNSVYYNTWIDTRAKINKILSPEPDQKSLLDALDMGSRLPIPYCGQVIEGNNLIINRLKSDEGGIIQKLITDVGPANYDRFQVFKTMLLREVQQGYAHGDHHLGGPRGEIFEQKLTILGLLQEKVFKERKVYEPIRDRVEAVNNMKGAQQNAPVAEEEIPSQMEEEEITPTQEENVPTVNTVQPELKPPPSPPKPPEKKVENEIPETPKTASKRKQEKQSPDVTPSPDPKTGINPNEIQNSPSIKYTAESRRHKSKRTRKTFGGDISDKINPVRVPPPPPEPLPLKGSPKFNEGLKTKSAPPPKSINKKGIRASVKDAPSFEYKPPSTETENLTVDPNLSTEDVVKAVGDKSQNANDLFSKFKYYVNQSNDIQDGLKASFDTIFMKDIEKLKHAKIQRSDKDKNQYYSDLEEISGKTDDNMRDFLVGGLYRKRSTDKNRYASANKFFDLRNRIVNMLGLLKNKDGTPYTVNVSEINYAILERVLYEDETQEELTQRKEAESGRKEQDYYEKEAGSMFSVTGSVVKDTIDRYMESLQYATKYKDAYDYATKLLSPNSGQAASNKKKANRIFELLKNLSVDTAVMSLYTPSDPGDKWGQEGTGDDSFRADNSTYYIKDAIVFADQKKEEKRQILRDKINNAVKELETTVRGNQQGESGPPLPPPPPVSKDPGYEAVKDIMIKKSAKSCVELPVRISLWMIKNQKKLGEGITAADLLKDEKLKGDFLNNLASKSQTAANIFYASQSESYVDEIMKKVKSDNDYRKKTLKYTEGTPEELGENIKLYSKMNIDILEYASKNNQFLKEAGISDVGKITLTAANKIIEYLNDSEYGIPKDEKRNFRNVAKSLSPGKIASNIVSDLKNSSLFKGKASPKKDPEESDNSEEESNE